MSWACSSAIFSPSAPSAWPTADSLTETSTCPPSVSPASDSARSSLPVGVADGARLGQVGGVLAEMVQGDGAPGADQAGTGGDGVEGLGRRRRTGGRRLGSPGQSRPGHAPGCSARPAAAPGEARILPKDGDGPPGPWAKVTPRTRCPRRAANGPVRTPPPRPGITPGQRDHRPGTRIEQARKRGPTQGVRLRGSDSGGPTQGVRLGGVRLRGSDSGGPSQGVRLRGSDSGGPSQGVRLRGSDSGGPTQGVRLRGSDSGGPTQGVRLRGSDSGGPTQGVRLRGSDSGGPTQGVRLRGSDSGGPTQGVRLRGSDSGGPTQGVRRRRVPAPAAIAEHDEQRHDEQVRPTSPAALLVRRWSASRRRRTTAAARSRPSAGRRAAGRAARAARTAGTAAARTPAGTAPPGTRSSRTRDRNRPSAVPSRQSTTATTHRAARREPATSSPST